MITVYHVTKRGAHIGNSFSDLKDAKLHMLKLCKRHIQATAYNETDKPRTEFGRVWFDDGNQKWNWYIKKESV